MCCLQLCVLHERNVDFTRLQLPRLAIPRPIQENTNISDGSQFQSKNLIHKTEKRTLNLLTQGQKSPPIILLTRRIFISKAFVKTSKKLCQRKWSLCWDVNGIWRESERSSGMFCARGGFALMLRVQETTRSACWHEMNPICLWRRMQICFHFMLHHIPQCHYFRYWLHIPAHFTRSLAFCLIFSLVFSDIQRLQASTSLPWMFSLTFWLLTKIYWNSRSFVGVIVRKNGSMELAVIWGNFSCSD